MINKEDIKVGDLVKTFDRYYNKVRIKVVDRINKLSFGLRGDWNPIKFNESQSCFKMTNEEIKQYFDEEFEELCKENNKFASKYIDKLEHISKLLRELSKEEHITYSINIDSLLEGIQKEVLKIENRYKEENKNGEE